jgi:myosin-crossreactive antigen
MKQLFDIEKRIKELERAIHDMKLYMEAKMMLEDWHAVADAAMDIRELEAELLTLRKFCVSIRA